MNWHDYWKIGKMFKKDGIINEEFNHMMEQCRCPKCVYVGTCPNFDKGDCSNYKRDPPDGGYYG